MAILDPTRNRCSTTRRAAALGLAAVLFVTSRLGGSWPVANAQDAGETAVQLLTEAQQAMREKRFDDAYRLASEVLEADPADESAAAVRDKAVAGKLKEKVSLNFADTPVKDVVAYLAKASGIDMIVDPDVTEAKSAEITLKVEGMPLENALEIIVRRFAKLDYFILDGSVYVSDEQGLIVYGLLRYDVRDLLSTPADSRLDAEVGGGRGARIKGDASANARAASLVRLVLTFIDPDSWRYAAVSREGKDGDIRVEVRNAYGGAGGEIVFKEGHLIAIPNARWSLGSGIVFRRGHLIARQTQAVHREIARFLDMLRSHREPPAGPGARPRASESNEPTSKEARLSAQAWQAILEERFEDAHRIAAQILDIDPQDVLAKIVRDRASDERPAAKVSQFRQQVWSKLRLCLERPLRRKAPPADRATPRGPGRVRDTPEITEIKEKLEQEISREFPDTYVADIVAYFQDVSGINMMLDPDAIEGEPKISVKAEGTRVRTLLHAILRGVHLDYVVWDGDLFISSEEGLSDFVLRSYDVRSIVAEPKSGGSIERRAVELLALVTTVVGRDWWRYAFLSNTRAGGDLEVGLASEKEDALAGIVFREGDLIVWQTSKMHAEIDKLLRKLHNGSGSGAGYAFRAFGPVVERSVSSALASPATFIDLDTGKVHAPPPDLDLNDVEAVQAWGRKRGVDAMATAGSQTSGLVCFDTIVLPIQAREWHAVASPALRRCRGDSGSAPRVTKIRGCSDEDPLATYAFGTREGAVGALRIAPGMNIRYKMLKWHLWATPGHNLVENPGFEEGCSLPDHWEPFDYSNRVLSCRDTLVKRSGTASLRLSRAEGRFAPINNVFQEMRSVLPGGKLSVSAYVRAEGIETALIDVAFLNEMGECIRHERVGDVVRGTHDWREYSGTFAVPTNARDARILLETNGAGRAWFDDLAASIAE